MLPIYRASFFDMHVNQFFLLLSGGLLTNQMTDIKNEILNKQVSLVKRLMSRHTMGTPVLMGKMSPQL